LTRVESDVVPLAVPRTCGRSVRCFEHAASLYNMLESAQPFEA
jgi:hypothetical protein